MVRPWYECGTGMERTTIEHSSKTHRTFVEPSSNIYRTKHLQWLKVVITLKHGERRETYRCNDPKLKTVLEEYLVSYDES